MTRADEMVLQFRDVLKETERFDADELRAYQEKLLEPLLLHARKHAPFYRTRLDPLFDGDEVDWARWREIPLLTRAEAQAREKALHAKVTPPHLGWVGADETSGSTGRPLRYLRNELMDIAGLAMMDRLYRWWGFDGDKTLAYFVSPRREIADPTGIENFGWRSGHMKGRHLMRDTSGDVDPHLDWLADIRPAYLVSYASMVPPFAERARERGLKLRFDRVITRGGIVTDEVRALCSEVFGGPLVDQYGADEIGQIACECPHCGAYHINSEAVLVEILDEEGAPVAPGKTGRVVLTNLYNYAMPLIRYEIGDFATVSPTASNCKIRLPSLTRIIGRYRNTFTLADGRILFPNVPMSGFRKFLPHSQIQI
ncbi:MAG: hypothetical protein OEM91_09030, partial [Hyphomicrobiales bacterium]|nr:hypothetical protein [Hyphomicrobiales bacterium]